MRIALLSDVHGNIRALNAVLADARRQGIDRYVFLGDMVFMGLAPQACLDSTMELDPLICIKGNTDANLEEISTFIPQRSESSAAITMVPLPSECRERKVKYPAPRAEEEAKPPLPRASPGVVKPFIPTTPYEEHLRDLIVDCDSRLDDAAKQTIAGWPASALYTMGQVEVLFCHGSPYSASEKLLPGDATGTAIQQKLEQESAQLIVCGHTHQSGDFTIGHKRVVNPGAIGYSFDGDPQASYAIIEDAGASIACEIRKVSYDIDAYKREIRDRVDSECTLSKSLLYVLNYGFPQAP